MRLELVALCFLSCGVSPDLAVVGASATEGRVTVQLAHVEGHYQLSCTALPVLRPMDAGVFADELPGCGQAPYFLDGTWFENAPGCLVT